MYIISVMIFTFSIRDFGHPKFLKSQLGHPVMKSLFANVFINPFASRVLTWYDNFSLHS